MKPINEIVVQKCIDYIKEHYSFEELLRQYNLMEKSEHGQGSNILIPCPYHVDYSPSMSVDLEGQRFKCFACNTSGNYISFVANYDKKVKGMNTNYYNTLDRLLKDDNTMQLVVGAFSIFAEEKVDIKNFSFSMRRPNLKTIDGAPTSYIELANRMVKDKKDSIENIKTMILLMQSDFTPKDIYNRLYGVKDNSNSSTPTESVDNLKVNGVFNIQSLLGGDD